LTKWHWSWFFSKYIFSLLIIIPPFFHSSLSPHCVRCAVTLTKQHNIISLVLSQGLHLWLALGWCWSKGSLFCPLFLSYGSVYSRRVLIMFLLSRRHICIYVIGFYIPVVDVWKCIYKMLLLSGSLLFFSHIYVAKL
jgi:hypothetical protein